jgi:hypothetical protein
MRQGDREKGRGATEIGREDEAKGRHHVASPCDL